jgi:hypothetical protein
MWGQAFSWVTLVFAWLMAFAIGIAIYFFSNSAVTRLLDRAIPLGTALAEASRSRQRRSFSFDATVLPRSLREGENG